MVEKLLRDDFIRRSTDFAGRVSIPPSRALMLTSIASLAVLVMGVTALMFLKQRVTEHATGFITVNASRIAVASSLASEVTLDNIFVKEGQRVVPGNLLALVSGPDLRSHPVLENRTNLIVVVTQAEHGKPNTADLVSASDGFVDRVIARPGHKIQPGEAIMTLAPDLNKVKVEMLVSSRVALRTVAKDRFYVKVDSYALRELGTISASVEGVSAYALTPLEIVNLYGVAPPSESKFVLSLLLDDSRLQYIKSKLKPGTSIDVQIPLEEQSLLSWITNSLVSKKDSAK
ncbi:HlyD family efflux transporter periplasmic adaptor subunit [Xanthomonas vasicola]|uniref:HlyD family efflux transporter periplasmic adaptor subunit n=1 Tax=Xanthomonas vasicola TaxID=56459 RepID=UPI001650F7F2|nr:HlyD family efflux transporter periplasmic adaptor subunit [Xanthomonas vasicola]